jgi:hypothetical protein
MINRAILLSLFAATAAGGQATRPRQAFLAETVSDLAASERWYETHLGTRRIAHSKAPSGFAENSLIANDYLMVELIHFTEPAKSDTAIRDPRAVGMQKVGVFVEGPIFDSTLARLRRLNATFVGGVFTDSATHARMFIVKDNSAVLIQFFSALTDGAARDERHVELGDRRR